MSDEAPVLLYLEADDEVTTVVRRLRQAEAGRVVLVAPGRSRATSSVVALRLLARVAEESGITIGVVGDPLTRSLAAEAGLETYASVDDARGAVAAPIADPASRRASIHVVRGDRLDETAPTIAAVAAPPPPPVDEVTRVGHVAAAPPGTRTAPGAPRPLGSWRVRLPLAAMLGILAVVATGVIVLGAMLLPAATIVVTPRSGAIGPIEYSLVAEEAQRNAGVAEETATVTATGTYQNQVAASGAVVLHNFNSFPVAVEQGTFVAAGEQAFATNEAIVVPAGTLTSDGRIRAGDASVGVTAAAIGEAANVPALAIDTVVNEATAARLRGFPNNGARLVENPEATAGGLDTVGPEFLEADVDAAVAALQEALAAAVANELGSAADTIAADAAGTATPTIEGLDGLVGTRDQPEAEIRGELAYDRRSVERAAVTAQAEERFASDADVLPADHELVPDATTVAVGQARVEGDELIVAVIVSGRSTARLDRELVLERVRGRTATEAEAALADLGEASVTLWPGWVASVPELDWRIDLRLSEASGQP